MNQHCAGLHEGAGSLTPRELACSGARPVPSFLEFCDKFSLCLTVLGTDFRVRVASETFVHRLNLERKVTTGRDFFTFVQNRFHRPLLQGFKSLVSGQETEVRGRVRLVRDRSRSLVGRIRAVWVEDVGDGSEGILVLIEPERSIRGKRDGLQSTLSEMDSRILEYVATGLTNMTIAEKLYMSRPSIDYHVSGLFRMFSVNNRSALIAKAYSIGLLSSGVWPPKVATEGVEMIGTAAANAV